MFKFDFSIDDEAGSDDEIQVSQSAEAGSSKAQAIGKQVDAPYLSTSLEELITYLPTTISYSPLRLSIAGEEREILRRDLYDARFQVMDQGENLEQNNEAQDDDKYIDADTDLIPGTYEGGLKTWEGGIDLVEVLAEYDRKTKKLVERIRGKRVIEVGCGTALPILYLLQRLLESPPSEGAETTIFHLQDYNLSVLQLVTLPNLVLATIPSSHFDQEQDDLDITPEIVEIFKTRLEEHKIRFEFSYGPWEGLAARLQRDDIQYDLMLTAETIYREDSVSSLLDVLKHGSTTHGPAVKSEIRDLNDLDKLDLSVKWPENETVILVAAKILYFGVGGGLVDFLRQVTARGGDSEDIKSWPKGVGRKVVRIFWPRSIE